MYRINRPLLTVLALGASAASLFAQGPERGGPPPFRHGPPPSPLFEVLDTNHDGVISAEEVANASAALKSLTDASGQITRESLRPARRQEMSGGPAGPEATGDNARPRGRRPDREWRPRHRPPPGAENDGNGAEFDARPPLPPRPAANPVQPAGPVPSPAATAGPTMPNDLRGQSFPVMPAGSPGAESVNPNQPGGGPAAQANPGGPAQPRMRHQPPPSPLFDALDANHDGVISTEEMENAAAVLKKLDVKGTGRLTREDLRPSGPPRPGN